MIELLRSGLLDAVPHGFSTRVGLAADDVLPGAPLVRVNQVHSPDALILRDIWDTPPTADAMVTDRPGLLLGIVTADCAPVLFHDPEAHVVGAAHAGWRGAHGGVIENTLAAMVELGAQADRIRAAIGPTIAQASYEVDEGFRAQFGPDDAIFFVAGRADHWQFDLPAYVVHRLQQAGVTKIDDLAQDTYAGATKFFSFRRSTHRGEDTGGRQLSVIGLRN
ncbi:peptidoglycan editing factor PgeF [Erythrobacter mangrovi]|uniref:Purine nucleoside phosphorylase n=1 Tax=Erythrobacter mangrovi TaxID=2739433 RepID=A0A7D3XR88_9SPHN|nr:peptidoglycan editing factor PgeF [Erythrobacter mangrovi]QKG70991.1 peptidoglycan editing factor PgeF [Erythrobacter mangrovi]